jgi:GT2 family glycosyltransferase
MTQNETAVVAVVILNWNGWRHTVQACNSIIATGDKRLKLLVVDNASTDESVVRLRAALPETELICNSVNGGFAGGCNMGIQRALEAGCDYVFLLNNDAMVARDAVAELVAASNRLGDCAILGSVVRDVGSEHCQFFGSQGSARFGQPRWYEYPRDKEQLANALIPTDFAIGAALFVPRAVFQTVGVLDERFYLTYEDIDFCYRARTCGVQSFIVSSSSIHHHRSATMGPETAPLQSYFLTRNELLFAEKHSALSQRLGLYSFRLARFVKRVLKSVVAGRLTDPSLRAMALGFRDFGFRRFGNCPDIVRRLASTWHQI